MRKMDLLFKGRIFKRVVKNFSGVRVFEIIKRSKNEDKGNKKNGAPEGTPF